VGISNGILTEIVGGISEGTVVVTNATIGQMPGESAMPSPQGEQKESSPFMPARPGSRNNKK